MPHCSPSGSPIEHPDNADERPAPSALKSRHKCSELDQLGKQALLGLRSLLRGHLVTQTQTTYEVDKAGEPRVKSIVTNQRWVNAHLPAIRFVLMNLSPELWQVKRPSGAGVVHAPTVDLSSLSDEWLERLIDLGSLSAYETSSCDATPPLTCATIPDFTLEDTPPPTEPPTATLDAPDESSQEDQIFGSFSLEKPETSSSSREKLPGGEQPEANKTLGPTLTAHPDPPDVASPLNRAPPRNPRPEKPKEPEKLDFSPAPKDDHPKEPQRPEHREPWESFCAPKKGLFIGC